MKFFNNKSNIFITLIAGLVLGWGLSYTNCGHVKNTDVSNETKPLSTTTIATNPSVAICPPGWDWNGTQCIYNDFPIGPSRHASCGDGELFVEDACYKADQIVSNPNNPLDYIGREHNVGLDYLITRLPKEGASIEKTTDTLKDYSALSGFNYDSKVIEAVSNHLKNPSAEAFSKNVQSYLNKVDTILQDNSKVKDRFDQFVKVESVILGDRSLSTQERDQLLAMLSVGRFSSYYWSAINNGNNNPPPVGKLKADLIGGALGLVGGPWGAIICGMFGSFGAEQGWW